MILERDRQVFREKREVIGRDAALADWPRRLRMPDMHAPCARRVCKKLLAATFLASSRRPRFAYLGDGRQSLLKR